MPKTTAILTFLLTAFIGFVVHIDRMRFAEADWQWRFDRMASVYATVKYDSDQWKAKYQDSHAAFEMASSALKESNDRAAMWLAKYNELRKENDQ